MHQAYRPPHGDTSADGTSWSPFLFPLSYFSPSTYLTILPGWAPSSNPLDISSLHKICLDSGFRYLKPPDLIGFIVMGLLTETRRHVLPTDAALVRKLLCPALKYKIYIGQP
jgi:hypothetical protein